MSTSICWEAGLTCEGCGGPIELGEEMLYKRHLRCARERADTQRQEAGEAEAPLDVAHRKLAAGGRITLTAGQLRALISQSGLDPVRRPDAGRRQRWYGSVPGWSVSRVEAGLCAAEVAGLYLDYLDTGRMPPIRAADLRKIVAVIAGVPA